MLPELAARPGFQRFVAVAAVAVVVIGIAVAGGREPERLKPGEARLEVEGVAEVRRVTGEREVVTGSSVLRAGDEVTVVSGVVRMILPSGATLEGRQAFSEQVDDTRIKMGTIPELLKGELLVVGENGVSIESASNGIVLSPVDTAGSAARVKRTRVGVTHALNYIGSIDLDSAGQRRQIPALRQMSVSVLGTPPRAPEPLQYDEADPWDRRFLATAMDLSRTLEALAQATTQSEAPTERFDEKFFEENLPALSGESEFTAGLLATRATEPKGDTLVGAAIAAHGRRGTFTERWNEVFDFRDQDAKWGLVAVDQGVSPGPLVSDIENALNGTFFQFAQPITEEEVAAAAALLAAETPVAEAPPPVDQADNEVAAPVIDSGSGGDAGEVVDEPVPPPVTTPDVNQVLPSLDPVVDPVVGVINTTTGAVSDGSNGLLPDLGIPLLDNLVQPVDTLLGGLLRPR